LDIFISWSGSLSKKISETIREWIPCVVQAAKPYYTPDDIAKGQRWSTEIATKLELAQIGIFILTPENIKAPWIMFEAGAISKNIGSASVCPILFNVSPTDIQGPLLQFQCVTYSQSEFYKLIQAINQKLADKCLDDSTLRNSFNKWWPELEEKIAAILLSSTEDSSANSESPSSKRSERDILEEILKLSRRTAFSHARAPEENSSIFNNSRKNVTFDPELGIITFWEGRTDVYDFTIDRLGSGAEVLDWFFQVNNKRWCTAQHLKEFLDCLEEITEIYFNDNAQGVFCPGGANKTVDWESSLRLKNSD
jgi:hypothetical protein